MPIEVGSLRDKNGNIKKQYDVEKEHSHEEKHSSSRKHRGDRAKESSNDSHDYTPDTKLAPPLTEAQQFENLTYNINREIMPEGKARYETALQTIQYNKADDKTKALMLEEVVTISTLPPSVRKKGAQEAGIVIPKPKNNAHGDNYSFDVEVVTGKNKKTGKPITESHHIDIIKDGKLQDLTIKDQGYYILHIADKAKKAREELPDSKVGQTFDIAHFTQDFEGADLKGSGISETTVSAFMADVSINYCIEAGIRPHILQEDPRIVEMVKKTTNTGVLPAFSGNYNMGLRGEIADSNASKYPKNAHLTISNHFDGAIHGNAGGTFGQINPSVKSSQLYGKYVLSEVDNRGMVNNGGNNNKLISSHRGLQTESHSPTILVENGNGYNKAEAAALGSAESLRQQTYATFNGVVKANLALGNHLSNSPQVLLAQNELNNNGLSIKETQLIARYDYSPQLPKTATPLEQGATQLASTQGTGELLKNPQPQIDFVTATGFNTPLAPAAEPERATPVREQILAAAGSTGRVVKEYVSAQGEALSNMLTNLTDAANVVKADVPAPAAPAQGNPFNVEQALAKADIKPAQPESKPQTQPQETEEEFIKAKVTEVFARFNGEQGKLVPVYQRHDKLSPTDRAAATLVQQSYNLIGIGNFTPEELGHVEGGKTARVTKEYNRQDTIVGEQTYAKLEQDVLKAIDKDPAKGKEFVANAEKIVNQQLAEIAAENKNYLVDNNTAAKDPSKDLAANHRSTGRDGVPS